MAEAGLDVRNADLFVGTSSGARVAPRLASSVPVQDLFERQLPAHTWPGRKLLIVAVNAETGERRAFDRNSGIDLVDAVIATTAFFGWPPALFEGHHYIDGGFYSSQNADLAAGFERVLILALRAPASSVSLVSPEVAVETLRTAGASVKIIHPDEETLAAFASVGSPSSPMVRGPAAKAGRAQGRRLVDQGALSIWQ